MKKILIPLFLLLCLPLSVWAEYYAGYTAQVTHATTSVTRIKGFTCGICQEYVDFESPNGLQWSSVGIAGNKLYFTYSTAPTWRLLSTVQTGSTVWITFSKPQAGRVALAIDVQNTSGAWRRITKLIGLPGWTLNYGTLSAYTWMTENRRPVFQDNWQTTLPATAQRLQNGLSISGSSHFFIVR